MNHTDGRRGAHHALTADAGCTRRATVARALVAALCLAAACLPAAAATLDTWRAEIERVRILAENDAPRAYEDAKRLEAEAPAAATPADRARILNLRARTAIHAAQTEEAADLARRAYELAKADDDRVGQAESDLNVALNSVNQARIDDLITSTTRALATLEGIDRPDLLGEALLRTSVMYRRIGQIEESVALAVQAMEIARRGGNPRALAYAHQGLAISYDQSERITEARDHYAKMREYARGAQSKVLEAYALAGLGGIANRLGDARAADAYLRESIRLFRATGTPFNISVGLFALAEVLRLQGRYTEALPLIEEVLATYARFPNRIGQWFALNGRSQNYQALGNLAAALADAERAQAIAKEIGFHVYLSGSARRVAAVAAARGDLQRAYRLSLEADEITAKAAREKSGARMIELAQRYQAEGRRREIEELTRRNEQQAAELRQRQLQQRWLWTVAIGSAVALAIVAFFLFRLQRTHRVLAALNAQLQRTRDELQDQSSLLRSILDSMGDGVSVANEKGELLIVNPAGERIVGLGVTPGDYRNWTATYGLYLPDQATPYPTEDLPVVRAIRGESCDHVEMFVRNPNVPEGRWLSVTARPLTDKSGVIRGGVAVFSDVTARKRADEEIRALAAGLEQRVQARTAELRQQTLYLRALIDTLPWWVWMKDTESRYLAANEAAAGTGGLTADQMIGKTDFDVWPPDIAHAYRADDIEVMLSRRPKTAEERAVGPQGATTWIETFKAPVIDEDGTVLGTVGYARDISERKAAEAAREVALAEAERLARLRSEFLSQMSHELRTPLNAILGYAQILRRDTTLAERQLAGLTVIQQSGEHLLTLINDLLDFARIEAGKIELTQSDVALAPLLDLIAEIVRVKAEEKHLRFVIDIASDLPRGIRADEKRLRQVLLNLLSNAVKFTDRGQVTLRVTAPAPQRLRFEVLDTGIGIHEDQLGVIFRPFEQAGDPRRRSGGTGLGLAISRQYARMMGSDIRVESKPGAGSRFWFDLDAQPVEMQPAPAMPEGCLSGYAGPRRRVLVTDDLAENRAFLVDALGQLGFEVAEAVDGRDGLAKAQSLRPDLILMDIVMPEMDGLEATRRLREIPFLAQVPIIAVSASASSADEEKSLAQGANVFLPKPVDLRRLLAEIGRLLNLEWIEEAPSPAPAPHGDEPLEVPPRQEMETLHHLAQRGNMRDIGHWAGRVAEIDGHRYRSFAQYVGRLAERFESHTLLGLVEKYLDEPQQLP
jgi:PAS domain S-box-containing protein